MNTIIVTLPLLQPSFCLYSSLYYYYIIQRALTLITCLLMPISFAAIPKLRSNGLHIRHPAASYRTLHVTPTALLGRGSK